MVFSGIVEEVGAVRALERCAALRLWDGSTGEGWVLTVEAAAALVGAYVGASIAVNGTCLTVTALDATSFTVGLAPETVRRTNLLDCTPGSPVNLERALPADGRNSGHYVQGHVDGTGVIESFTREGDSLWVRIGRVPPGVMRGIIPKGFIAVDGTSLTVCDVDTAAGWFSLMLISHTQTAIALPRKPVGARVNLEADALGKYAAAAADAAVGALARGLAALETSVTASVAALAARLDALEARAAGASGAAAVAGVPVAAGASPAAQPAPPVVRD